MDFLYLRCDCVRYKLVSFDGKNWWLAQMIDQYIIKDWLFHPLDYWRKKGVIEDYEEKTS